ncbi:MAG: hypothetical protein OJF60_001760 [Burkholderiaceae bacterium]|nr:MAG: hypothetical protein OJF60_001760 [Burkholderiaceae bacterium]
MASSAFEGRRSGYPNLGLGRECEAKSHNISGVNYLGFEACSKDGRKHS